MKKIFLIVIIGLISITSCYYDSEEALFPVIDSTNAKCDTVNITYSGYIEKMINNYCISCHGGGGSTVLVTYDDVSAKSDRILGAIEHKSGFLAMPQGGAMLDSCLIKQFAVWINEGKPDK